MSRITKCICDGCGTELAEDPIAVYAEKRDLETGELLVGDYAGYYNPGKDLCAGCMKQIIAFINGLPARNAGKPAVINQDFEKLFHTAGEKKTDAKNVRNQKKNGPTIKELLEQGKSDKEIMQITGCTKGSLWQTRYRIKKEAGEESGVQDPLSSQKEGKTYQCSKVQKSCEYAGRTGGQVTCDFAIQTGHSRGGDPEACTRYRKKRGK